MATVAQDQYLVHKKTNQVPSSLHHYLDLENLVSAKVLNFASAIIGPLPPTVVAMVPPRHRWRGSVVFRQ